MSAPIGQIPKRVAITNITNALPCVVTTEDDHDFPNKSFVRLTQLNGCMPSPHGVDQLNNYKFRVIVTSSTEFKLQDPITFKDIDSTTFPPYITGGSCNLVNPTFIFYPSAEQEYPNQGDKMAKHAHVANRTEGDIIGASLDKVEQEKVSIEEMPLNSIRDYRLYNEEARRLNKKLRISRYPIKQCPVELHPKQRIKFTNNDQSMNPVPVFISNHLIHFDEKLIPGKTYDLPECIVHYLSEKGYPVWDWVTLKDGSRETHQTGVKPRFGLTTVYQER